MPNPTQNRHCAAEIEQIKPLIGGTITSTLTTPDGENFGFQVRKTDGKLVDVWVDCDPEGNGPGHLNIEIRDPR